MTIDSHDKLSKIADGVRYIYLFSLARVLLQLVIVSLLARLIGPETYGVMAAAAPAVLVLSSITEFGLADAIVQRKKQSAFVLNSLFWLSLTLAFLIVIVLSFLLFILYFFDFITLTKLIIFLSLFLSVPFSSASAVYAGIIRRNAHYFQHEVAAFFSMIFSSLVALTFAFLDFDITALVLQVVSYPVLLFLFFFFLTDWRPRYPRSLIDVDAFEIFRFGLQLSLSRAFTQFAQSFSILASAWTYSSNMAGVYYRFHTLTNLVHQRLASPLATVFLPLLSRRQGDSVAHKKAIFLVQSFISMLLVPIAAVFLSLHEPLVTLILGSSWAAYSDYLPFFAPVIFQISFTFSFQWALVSRGFGSLIFRQRLVLSFFQIVLVFVAVSYGLRALLWSQAIFYIFVQQPIVWFTASSSGIIRIGYALRRFVLDLLFLSVHCLSFLLILRFFSESSIFLSLICSVIFALVMIMLRLYFSLSLRNFVVLIIRRS